MALDNQGAMDEMKATRRIAVIEADELVRELVGQWLVEAGYLVDAYPSPTRLDSADLIIADIASPREAGSLLVQVSSGKNVPVLLLSARFRRGQGGSVQLANELGVKGVLPKPFTQRQLLTAVRQALSR
jgi:DNA-binding response OmpR family regulator